MMQKKPLFALALLTASTSLWAANAGINKVFSPTVEYGEREIELRGWRAFDNDDALDGAEIDKVDFAYGVTTWWTTELEFVYEKAPGEGRELEAIASENFFQLSEQGEYWADFGFFFEYEEEREADVKEVVLGPIIQKEFGLWTATINLFFEHEFGDDAEEHKWEPLASLQWKYRAGGAIDPGVEAYSDEYGFAIGPVLLGEHKINHQKLKWQLALLLGNGDDVADKTLRWAIEYEF